MKTALRRMFLKNWAILLVVFVLFAFFKYSATGQRPVTYRYLDEWVERCAGASDEEIDALRDEIIAKIAESEDYSEAVSHDFNKFTQSYGNRRTVAGWIEFAKNGQGSYGTLPNDMEQNRAFYEKLDLPWIFNGEYLEVYDEYQKLDVVSVLVVLLSIVFWGMHYEMEIYRFTDTVRDGRIYTATLRTVLLLLSLAMLVVNELVDLHCSGLLEHRTFWRSPVQSYSSFRSADLHGDMLDAFILVWIGKVCNTVLLCALSECVARHRKSVKDSTIAMFVILLTLMFSTKALVSSSWLSLLQLGVVDWVKVIQKTTLVWSGIVSTTVLGLIGLILVTGVLLLLQWTPPYRGIRKRTG